MTMGTENVVELRGEGEETGRNGEEKGGEGVEANQWTGSSGDPPHPSVPVRANMAGAWTAPSGRHLRAGQLLSKRPRKEWRGGGSWCVAHAAACRPPKGKHPSTLYSKTAGCVAGSSESWPRISPSCAWSQPSALGAFPRASSPPLASLKQSPMLADPTRPPTTSGRTSSHDPPPRCSRCTRPVTPGHPYRGDGSRRPFRADVIDCLDGQTANDDMPPTAPSDTEVVQVVLTTCTTSSSASRCPKPTR